MKVEAIHMIREVRFEDLDAMLELYLDLHEVSVPEKDEHLMSTAAAVMRESASIMQKR